jgi:hypothetical protein
MSAEELRRWVAARQAGARREAELAADERPSPAEAFERALALIELSAEMHGWPLPEDPTSLREDHLAYERWARLRRRLGAP